MKWINIAINALSASQSWSSYWKTQSEVLFFAETKNIADGKLYNQKTGATDYLTVGGSAGLYTFQTPNNATYKAADTDYIWFKTDETQRTTTEAELIGYDLQRTPVKYDDASPNSIRAIMILSSAVTGAKRDRLFRDMWLMELWDNNLNAYGHIKSNRAAQNLWIPEAVTILSDTFTDTDNVHLHDHVMNLGAGWTAPVNFIISGNKLAFSGASNGDYAVSESGKANVDITIDVDMPNQNQYYGGLTFRYQDNTHNWRLYVQRDAGGTPYLALSLNGTGTVATANITQETATNKLRVVCSGNSIKGYWKDITTSLIDVTNATYNDKTKHGAVGCFVAGYVTPIMDNFIVIG